MIKTLIVKPILSASALFLIIVLLSSAWVSGFSGLNGVLEVTRNPINLVLLFTALVVFLTFGYFLIKKLNNKPIHNRYFYLIFGGILLISLLLLFSTSIELQSDPKRYFNYAVEVSRNWNKLDLNDIYHQRIIPYTLPIVTVLPETLRSVQLVNVFLLITSIVIFTLLVKKHFNRKLAFLFLVIYASNLEIYFATTIASHDLASLFYLALILLIIDKLNATTSKTVQATLIVIGAILLALVDILRGIKIPLLISLLVSIFLISKSRFQYPNKGIKYHIMLILILSLGIMSFFNTLKSKYGKPESVKVVNGLGTMIYSYNDMYTLGDFWAGIENRYNYTPLMDMAFRQKRIVAKYTSQIRQFPLDYAFFIIRKSTHFFKNSFYHFFMDKRVVQQPIGVGLTLALSFSSLHKFLFYVLAALGLLIMLMRRTLTNHNFILILYPLVFLPIILQSEVNPTYSILVFPSIAVFAAYALHYLFEKELTIKTAIKGLKPLRNAMLYLGLILTMVYALILLASMVLPYKMIDFKSNTQYFNNTKVLDFNYISNPFEIGLKPLEKINKWEYSISDLPRFKTVDFLIRSKADVEDLKIYLNGRQINPIRSQADSRNQKTDYHYYYFNQTFETPLKQLMFSSPLEKELLIKEIIIE